MISNRIAIFTLIVSWIFNGSQGFNFSGYRSLRAPIHSTSLTSYKSMSSDVLQSDTEEKVIVCGGGIHGASIAYYLTLKGIKPTVIERTQVAAAASGKSGGFLARDWGDGGVTEPLHQLSYQLHAELAETLGIDSYRTLPTLNVNGRRKGKNLASWLDGKASSSLMDTNTAQVTPLELTEKLMAKAVENGATVRIGAVEGIESEEVEGRQSRHVTAVKVDGELVESDKVVIAMGPWSVVAEDWFGFPVPIEGIKSTSIVYQGCQPVVEEPFACFCAEDGNGCHLEIYPRPNGEVYICGIGGSDYVRGDRLREGGDCQDASVIAADPSRVAAASKSFGGLSSSLGSKPPDVVQACMRPCPQDSLPMMGSIPDFDNAFMSAGHNCWGILWAPISGLAMSELIAEGKSSTVDLSPFRPGRFMKKDRMKKRGRHYQDLSVGEQW